MEMKNILGLSERLIALIEKAQAEANEIVSKAQKRLSSLLQRSGLRLRRSVSGLSVGLGWMSSWWTQKQMPRRKPRR